MSPHAPAAAPGPARPSPIRWWVCGLLFLATVLNYMDRMALNQTALRIRLSLGFDNIHYARLEGAFSAGFAVGAITAGYLVDRISVRWIYPLVVLGWSLAGACTGFASAFWSLVACRFTLGLFEAGNWPCGIRTTRMILPPAERSLGNSLFQSGTAIGAVMTPLLMPTLLYWADPLEGERTAAMALIGGGYAAGAGAPSLSWQYPFRIIGALGVLWIALWFVVGPRRLLDRPADESEGEVAGPLSFRDVLSDRRYWVLFALVLSINVCWHGYRSWLPLYLQEGRGFSERQMQRFMALYYVVADLGSLAIGFMSLGLVRWGSSLHGSRTVAFGLCGLLTLSGLAVPFVSADWALQLLLLGFACGGLGLFPTYFAFSQEISARHQGKVTGSLGTLAYLSMILVYEVEGQLIDHTKSYEIVLGAIGVAPLLALALLLWVWPPWTRGRE